MSHFSANFLHFCGCPSQTFFAESPFMPVYLDLPDGKFLGRSVQHFCGDPFQTSAFEQPFLCARCFLLFTRRLQALMNPFIHFWSFLSQPENYFPDLSCSEIWILRRETQTQHIVFGTSAVSRLRNLPCSKSPFVPDLNLSNFGSKSYFRPFISYLIGLKLTDYQFISNFLSKNFCTIFPRIKVG